MQVDQVDYMIMEALADMNKAPANMERSQLDTLINDWNQYSEIISWAAAELQCVAQTEELVNPIKTAEDLPDFQMEFSGLLKELGCPYNTIMEQPLNSRFDAADKKKIMLNFVLSELQAARITWVHSTKSKQLKVELDESSNAKILREIIMELGLGKPPENIAIAQLWNNINGKLATVLKTTGVLDPLFDGYLSPSQWSQVEKYFDELSADYQKRREMLLKRLDVTVQSFHWSDRLKGTKEKEINDKFQQHRPHLSNQTNVKVSDILAARVDLPVLEKTASASVRKNTKSAVNSVVIGRVPDRGGRTDEIQPPPPEMPPWQQRQGGAPAGSSGWIQGGQGPRGGGRGRGGGGDGGGGRVQGGWSDRGGGRGGRGGRGDSNNQQYDNRGGGGGGYNQQRQQYDNRGGGGSGGGGYNNQYDNRGGGGGGGGYNNYQQQQQQSYNSGGGGGGGYYQHDNRGADDGGGYYQQDQQQQGRRNNRQDNDDRRDNYRGGGGGRGGYQRGGGGGGGRRY